MDCTDLCLDTDLFHLYQTGMRLHSSQAAATQSSVAFTSPITNLGHTTEGSSVHIPHMAPCTHSLIDVALCQVLPEAEGQTAPVAGLLVWPAQLACSVKRAVMLLGHNVLLCTPQLSCMHCNQDC